MIASASELVGHPARAHLTVLERQTASGLWKAAVEILTSGSISLQAESRPVEFRKVELLNLAGCRDRKATNYKSYFETEDRASCRYQ